ncbi:hypothetical protein [Nonomuraea sp. NPDC049684]
MARTRAPGLLGQHPGQVRVPVVDVDHLAVLAQPGGQDLDQAGGAFPD